MKKRDALLSPDGVNAPLTLGSASLQINCIKARSGAYYRQRGRPWRSKQA